MPIDVASVAAVDAARRPTDRAAARGPAAAQPVGAQAGSVRPLADGYTFAALPATVERLLLGRNDDGLPPAALGDAPARVERVVLVLLDAFGWRFLDRHADRHPLLRRFTDHGAVAKLTTQVPSATPAHVTTLHTRPPPAPRSCGGSPPTGPSPSSRRSFPPPRPRTSRRSTPAGRSSSTGSTNGTSTSRRSTPSSRRSCSRSPATRSATRCATPPP